MNQTKTGMTSGFSNTQKTNRSFPAVLLGGMFMLALQLCTVKADAQTTIPTDSFGCTQSITSTMTCVGAGGYYANNWVGSNKCWIWKVNTAGYTNIDMDFQTTKSATGGPTGGQISYSTTGPNGPWTIASGVTFTVSTSCGTKHLDLPVGCEGQSVLYVRAVMSGATVTTSTNRITAVDLFSGTASGCTTPLGGDVAADMNPVCAGTSAALSVTSGSGGAGITYQWQSSSNATSWSDIPGATGATYNTPTSLNDTMFYRRLSTCSGSPLVHISSDTLRLDVLVVPASNITGFGGNPLLVGGTESLSNSYPYGIWASSAPSVASVDGSGLLTGVFGGTTTVSYQVTDTVTGCVAIKTLGVNVVWPNTLALYAGSTGSNINVINVPGDTTSTLYNTGYGALATQCGSGGYSGLTLNAAADTSFKLTGPHTGYKVYAKPAGDSVLNMYRIHARVRTSGDGPKKAILAYRFWQFGGASSWIVAADTMNLSSSSCGDMENDWDFNRGTTVNPNPTQNGMDSLEVAIFPWAPNTNGGTFQIGSLEVYGIVTNSNDCDGTPVATTADSALPAVAYICDTGYRSLNYNIGTGGVAGLDISYQWQKSTNGTNFTDIPGATGVVYRTDLDTAGVNPDTTYYRVKIICDVAGDSLGISQRNMVIISRTPANAGTISGIPTGTGALSGIGRMFIGSTYNLTSSVAGGTWSSNDTSVISITSGGVATPHIPGDAVFTYRAAPVGCFASTKATSLSLYNDTKALYVGTGGNSTGFYVSNDAQHLSSPDSSLTLANWTSGTTCGNGGVSGLVNTTTVQDDATNGRVTLAVRAAVGTMVVKEVRATVRKQLSGAYQVYLGYKPHGSGSYTLSTPEAVETDDCGYSHNEVVFTFASPINVNTTGTDFTVFGYDGVAGPPATTFQVNSISVIGTTSGLNKPTGVNDVNLADNIQVYPNPAENTLNIDAAQAVNVAIFSIDGKKLLEQKNTKSINVSTLVSGMYIVTVSDANNLLLKTDKFVKK